MIRLVCLLSFLLLSFAFLIRTSEAQWNNDKKDRELLSDLRAVTFNAGRERTHRRVGGGPQLECVGGSAGCSAFTPQVVQCQQIGNEQWRCEADMPDDFAFGPLEVVCEGYEFPDDPYILKGSCSLEYNLELTSVGRQRRSRSQGQSHDDVDQSWSRAAAHRYSSRDSSFTNYYSSSPYSSSSSFITPLIVFGALFFLFRYLRSNNIFGLGGFGGGPGGFFGGHGGNFPPGGGGGYPGYPGGGCGPRYGSGGSGPGFLSGMAAGGALGYMFGNRGNNPIYGHPPGYRAPSLFGTAGGGGFSSAGGASFGGTTRTAFGGGGTRRR